ncbi:hypothetical protein HL658_10020 [Azospirillum sp. RWY-5-1]|uniref:Uncharacterized protein n=1 Tax=Azospirillum oleiclasticum TaxID=2735135 RepID=A0ABX2TA20_9PROT|nr:hypothetical protein [Azospirillum oleiclasticum]NYZ12888.1 hypothetical protein [Azospirillum oleiclasticum]NYZ20048.1 hypothetical protein [Azospirillum oleiclasticum]
MTQPLQHGGAYVIGEDGRTLAFELPTAPARGRRWSSVRNDPPPATQAEPEPPAPAERAAPEPPVQADAPPGDTPPAGDAPADAPAKPARRTKGTV